MNRETVIIDGGGPLVESLKIGNLVSIEDRVYMICSSVEAYLFYFLIDIATSERRGDYMKDIRMLHEYINELDGVPFIGEVQMKQGGV